MWCVPCSQLFSGLLRWGRSVTPCLFTVHLLYLNELGYLWEFLFRCFDFHPLPWISHPAYIMLQCQSKSLRGSKPACHISCPYGGSSSVSDTGWWRLDHWETAGCYGKETGMQDGLLSTTVLCPKLTQFHGPYLKLERVKEVKSYHVYNGRDQIYQSVNSPNDWHSSITGESWNILAITRNYNWAYTMGSWVALWGICYYLYLRSKHTGTLTFGWLTITFYRIYWGKVRLIELYLTITSLLLEE